MPAHLLLKPAFTILELLYLKFYCFRNNFINQAIILYIKLSAVIKAGLNPFRME